MTLIDADLACSLDQEILTIDPVNIKGLDSCIKSSKYVNLDLYMLGYMGDTAAAGKLHLKAHLVPNLCTNVLIGVEVIDAEGFNIKFDNKVVKISSCQKLQCPITVHTKPHCSKESIPVYATHTVNVPPYLRVNLPVFVKKNLPTECDFVFEPSNTFKKIAQYGHVVDCNLSFIEIFNTDSKPVKINHCAWMGSLTSRTYQAVYEVDIFTADVKLQDDVDLPPSPHHANYNFSPDPSNLNEKVLPNGVHVYSANDMHCTAFANLVLHHPVWGETEGFVEILEDKWMEIPLVPDWQSKVPWNRVYRQGPKEKAIIDKCFNQLHDQGCLSWAKGHTPSGYPAFIIYCLVCKPDGLTETKECVVIDL